MSQFLFVLDLPSSTVGMSMLSNATVDWSEFETKASAIAKQHKGEEPGAIGHDFEHAGEEAEA